MLYVCVWFWFFFFLLPWKQLDTAKCNLSENGESFNGGFFFSELGDLRILKTLHDRNLCLTLLLDTSFGDFYPMSKTQGALDRWKLYFLVNLNECKVCMAVTCRDKIMHTFVELHWYLWEITYVSSVRLSVTKSITLAFSQRWIFCFDLHGQLYTFDLLLHCKMTFCGWLDIKYQDPMDKSSNLLCGLHLVLMHFNSNVLFICVLD